eukprot:5829245-Ditylum_brightwellii.AAC.1
MVPKGPANNGHTNEEYDTQLIWDVDKEEPTEDEEDTADKDSLDELMEQAKEAGGKPKAEENEVLQTKQTKNEVKVSTK